MNSPVQKIKERLSIEEVISSYIKLEKTGNNLRAKCPFHNEKTPSFFISPARGSYYCFGCAASGDIFTFVEEFEGLDFKGALKLLADKAGVSLDTYNAEKESASSSEKERLYRAMEEATKYFEQNLSDNQPALEYLKSRGLHDKTIKDFRIGYALPEWRLLCSHLKSKGFSDGEIEKAGLGKKKEGSADMYDRFRGRIMFPMSDSGGRIVAFSGRAYGATETDGKSAKYLNSPETMLFKKSAVLYGLDKAKQAIRKNDFSIIVEGQFDLILAHQAGFKNTVATSGTALVSGDKLENNSVNNLGLISRLSQNIVFVFDGDMAGFNASIRATPIALALFSDMNVKATGLPDGMDPADLISKKGPDAWREVIRNAKHIIEFLVDKIVAMSKDTLKTKLEIENKIIPYLTLISNPVKRSHFVSLVSDKSGISENDIREKLKSVERELKDQNENLEKAVSSQEQVFRKDYILRRLGGIILWQKTLASPTLDVLATENQISETIHISASEILKKAESNKEDLIFEAEVFYGEGADLDKDVKELLRNLKEEYLKEELSEKMRQLKEAERDKDQARSALILQECQVISNRIQQIKNERLK